MAHRISIGRAVLAVVVAVTFACGDDSPEMGAAPPAPPPPVAAEFGLDARPPNPTCLARARPGSPTGIKLTPVFPGLSFVNPVAILQAPGDASKWYVIEQGEENESDATVRVFANDAGVAVATDFLRLPMTEIRTGAPDHEGGLLGFTFHPDFATNGTAFLSYTIRSALSPADMKVVVSRIRTNAGKTALDRATEETLTASDGRKLTFDSPTILHSTAHMQFGPDRLLYIAMGDGGEIDGNKGQDTATFFGKVLRIDAGATGPYAIPPTNPWVGMGGKLAETWAYGFRNPYRFSIDRVTGDLWVGDVGDELYEEINKVQKGGNYGWPVMEGLHCYGDKPCDPAGFLAPVLEYPHSNGNVAVVGGHVYRGSRIPGLQGSYIFADYLSGRIWRVAYNAANVASLEELAVAGFPISSIGEGADGELYALNYFAGKIVRIEPDLGQPGAAPFPEKLSATGCVDPNNPREAGPGLVPFDLNAPLFSDSAEKRRWMALPDGAQITVGPDGDFDFPNGTVLMKEFALRGRLIETRLFVRHDDGTWVGYSYEWGDDQTDATLLPGPKTKPVAEQTWTFPGRTECMQCHTAAAGRSLGPEIGQLNRDTVYTTTNRISNELRTLEHIGMFKSPLGDVATLARYATYAGPDPVEQRARAYLHANCANCHRPDGGPVIPMDLRFGQPFAEMHICNAAPEVSTFDIADAKLLAPGDPSKSILSLRMHATNETRMPPLARSVVDTEGTGLIDAWIGSVTACP